MGKARAILRRRRTIRNIRKITRTMEMVATARFKKFHQRAAGARAYTHRLSQLMRRLAEAAGGELEHPLLESHEEVPHAAMVVLASNRGLCGGYNVNVLRLARRRHGELVAERRDTDVYAVGKKAISFLRFHHVPLRETYTTFDSLPTFEQVSAIADQLIARFTGGELACVQVAYTQFLSAGSQRPAVMTLMPLAEQAPAPPPSAAEAAGKAAYNAIYEFLPDAATILGELLTRTVRCRLYQCFLDSMVSEQVARMTAMRLAGESADKMIRSLTMRYNRARQATITTELAEIMSGAEALK